MGITKIVGLSLRVFSKIRFRVLGLATIKDIPTEKFKELIGTLTAEGWRKSWKYQGYDAWIDYGSVVLRKGFTKLTFEWDNWTEGSVEGPMKTISSIAGRFGYKVSNEWRWSEYDKK